MEILQNQHDWADGGAEPGQESGEILDRIGVEVERLEA
jgi:hypothetical protein